MIRIERRVAHETANLSINWWFVADFWHASDTTPQAYHCIVWNVTHSGPPLSQSELDRSQIIADAGNNPETSYNDAAQRGLSEKTLRV
jgi:hypothetical protein